MKCQIRMYPDEIVLQRLKCEVQARSQRGVVLFLTLIALVIMSLAALALVRSVDTSTMISGNLAFKHSATMSAETGVEAAIATLTAIQNANIGLNALKDGVHPFNMDSPATGYYSSYDPALKLTDTSALKHVDWKEGVDCVLVGKDNAGNEIRYVIQRMCKTQNMVIQDNECLFAGDTKKIDGQEVKLPADICSGPGCPAAGQSPQYAITVKVTGPHNSESYVQNFVN